MSQETIMWILTAVLGGVDISTLVAVAIIVLKGVSKRVEDSTGIKGEVTKLNKKLSQVIEYDQELKCKYDALMLEMKGIKANGYQSIGTNREAKK